MRKVRNAPVNFVRIPRLELQAAKPVDTYKMLMEKMDLPIKCTKYWTDNEIVLHYLKNAKRPFKTYVANSVEEIRDNSQPERWNHEAGFLNPADNVLHGLTP